VTHTFTKIGITIACVLLGAGRVCALDVTLTNIDGSIGGGELVGLSPTSITWKTDGDTTTTSIEDLASISFHGKRSEPASDQPCVLYFVSGGHVSGTIAEPMRDGMKLEARVGDQMQILFASLKSITIKQNDWPTEARVRFNEAVDHPITGEDILLAKSEKAAGGVRAIRGTLLELGPSGGEFRFNNRTRRIKLNRIYAVILAAPATPARPQPSTIRLMNGDEFAGTLVSVEEDTITFMTGLNQSISCKVGELQSLTINNGRIVFLDTLSPHSHSSKGIVHVGWPFRTNRNVFNQPMRMDAVAFERGIGVHARSEILYRLDGEYETFAATIGLDDAVRPAGSVRFKILADDRDIYDSTLITGSDRAKPINVSVKGATWMTLIVETADGADIADWANWGAARLIKPKAQS